MGRLTPDQVLRTARLAGLALSDEECRRMADELEAVLVYAERLGRLDLDGVPPAHHPAGLTDVWRDDEVVPGSDREEVLAQAPAREGQWFTVPRVLPPLDEADSDASGGTP